MSAPDASERQYVSTILKAALNGLYNGHYDGYRSYLLFLSESDELRIKFSYNLDESEYMSCYWVRDGTIDSQCRNNEVTLLEVPSLLSPVEWTKRDQLDRRYTLWIAKENIQTALFHPIHDSESNTLDFVYVIESTKPSSETMLLERDQVRYVQAMGKIIRKRLVELSE